MGIRNNSIRVNALKQYSNTDKINFLSERVINALKLLKDNYFEFNKKTLFSKNGNKWLLPGDFEVCKTSNGVDVFKNDEYINTFSNKQNATAWCILVFNKKRKEARLLKHYDEKKVFIENNILINKKRFSWCDKQDDLEIASAKLTNDYQKLNSLKKQIDKLVSLAKYFQTRGFKYEAF